MRILVFEYITGGGMMGKALPASLQKEGGMMLQALLVDLKSLDDIQLCVTIDERCQAPAILAATEVVSVGAGQDIFALLSNLLLEADLFWPIAPESDGLLSHLAELAVGANVEVCLSSPATLAICANKYTTYQALIERGLPVIDTRMLGAEIEGLGENIVVKIADGVGCMDNFVIKKEQLALVISGIDQQLNYILQPYLSGQAASLSCLFRAGQAWLICYNHQQVMLQHGRFSLQGCLVNAQTDKLDYYRELILDVAQALPGLWGYIGIDIIESPEHGPLILEINPRLTTSYVGIRQATGLNVAEQVLRLRHAEPIVDKVRDETAYVSIN